MSLTASAYVRQSPSEVALGEDVNWVDLAAIQKGKPVGQKSRRLLEILAGRSTVGEWLAMDDAELAPLINAGGQNEVRYLLGHLRELKYIDQSHDGMGKKHVMLMVSGWEAVEPITGSGIPGTCFVAMSFDRSLDGAFHEGIRSAVEEDCGFRVIRVDREPHNDNITDRILAGIRTAQFVVADFTHQRTGVYYEAGFAQGLGRVVVRTCRSDDFDNLHFDTRQFFHLKWNTQSSFGNVLRITSDQL